MGSLPYIKDDTPCKCFMCGKAVPFKDLIPLWNNYNSLTPVAVFICNDCARKQGQRMITYNTAR